MIPADPITTVSVRDRGRGREMEREREAEREWVSAEQIGWIQFPAVWMKGGAGGVLNAKCSGLRLREERGYKKCICLNSLCCHCNTQVPAAKTQCIYCKFSLFFTVPAMGLSLFGRLIILYDECPSLLIVQVKGIISVELQKTQNYSCLSLLG